MFEVLYFVWNFSAHLLLSTVFTVFSWFVLIFHNKAEKFDMGNSVNFFYEVHLTVKPFTIVTINICHSMEKEPVH